MAVRKCFMTFGRCFEYSWAVVSKKVCMFLHLLYANTNFEIKEFVTRVLPKYSFICWIKINNICRRLYILNEDWQFIGLTWNTTTSPKYFNSISITRLSSAIYRIAEQSTITLKIREKSAWIFPIVYKAIPLNQLKMKRILDFNSYLYLMDSEKMLLKKYRKYVLLIYITIE